MLAKRTGAIALVAALSIGGAPAQEIGATVEEIVALAQTEPPVRVGSVWQPEIIEEISAMFRERYGLELEHERMTGLDSRERVLSEAMAGLVNYDLLNVSGELRDLYVEAGILEEIPWAELFPEIDPTHLSPDGYYVATGFSRYGILYNPELVAEQDVPVDWADCHDAKWRGQVGVHSRGRAFTALWTAWGEDGTLEFARRLFENNPVFSAGGTEALAQVAAGEIPLACGYAYHSYLNVINRDPEAPIRFVDPKVLPFHISEAFAVMRGARSPNAAVLLAALAVTDAQDAYRHIGRTSPFVEGSAAWTAAQEAGAEIAWVGWEFGSEDENEAAAAIVEAWGFTR